MQGLSVNIEITVLFSATSALRLILKIHMSRNSEETRVELAKPLMFLTFELWFMTH